MNLLDLILSSLRALCLVVQPKGWGEGQSVSTTCNKTGHKEVQGGVDQGKNHLALFFNDICWRQLVLVSERVMNSSSCTGLANASLESGLQVSNLLNSSENSPFFVYKVVSVLTFWQELFYTNREELKYYPLDSPPGTRLLTAFYTVYHGDLHR